MTFNQSARDWIARSLGSAPDGLAVSALKGSTSSSVYLVRDGAFGTRAVLRVLDNRAWLDEEPDAIPHEATALAAAQAAGLPAPAPIAWAEDAGFGAPALLMSFLEGAVEVRPASMERWLAGLAAELAAIHRRSAAGFPWEFRSWVNHDSLAVPGWTGAPRAWERAIDAWRRGPPPSPPVFIHRDYHPTNVLWRDGAVSGVVDWINACRGPAGVDVAHCRTNLVQMFGPDAADQFLGAYRAAAPEFAYHPHWDIDSVLDMCVPGPSFYPPWQDFGLEPIGEAELRRRIDAHLERVAARL